MDAKGFQPVGNPLESSNKLVQDGWFLLKRINCGMMPETVNRLFCDAFRITSNRASRLIADLSARGHILCEPGWITLKDYHG